MILISTSLFMLAVGSSFCELLERRFSLAMQFDQVDDLNLRVDLDFHGVLVLTNFITSCF